MGILCNGQNMILRGEFYCVFYRWEMQEIGLGYANANLAIKVRESLSRMQNQNGMPSLFLRGHF